jgi:hypothetical protein
LGCGGYECPHGNALAGKVKINLNMFGALVLNEVGGEVDGTDIVAVDQSGPVTEGCAAPQAADEANTPLSRPDDVGHDVVLRLSARTRDDALTL